MLSLTCWVVADGGVLRQLVVAEGVDEHVAERAGEHERDEEGDRPVLVVAGRRRGRCGRG